MNLYRLIRKIHLFATLVLATFIFMYFVTGFIMIFEETFQRRNLRVEKVKEKIDGIGSIEPDSLAEWSRKKYHLHGRHFIDENNESIAVDFSHPGTIASVRVLRSYDSVYFEVKKGNFNTVMHQYHRLHGFAGGWTYFTWALTYDLSAISMIIFSITGIYLWYKTERRRLVGWMVFLASTLLTFSTIYYLMSN
jgi:hypothetical protein